MAMSAVLEALDLLDAATVTGQHVADAIQAAGITDVAVKRFTGEKGSTSRGGGGVPWLPDFLERYKPDPLRYFLTANAPETRDTAFSWAEPGDAGTVRKSSVRVRGCAWRDCEFHLMGLGPPCH